MATRAQIAQALKAAHAAGKTEDAKRLAAAYRAAPADEAPAPAAPVKPKFANSALEQETFDPTEGMSTADKYIAAAGSTVDNTIRQSRRLGNKVVQNVPGVSHLARYMGFNPEENLAKLDEETEEARRINAPLLATKAGKAGALTGDILQGVALTAATGGLGAGAAAGGGARALANVAARDALAGGVQGALQDTGKGESITKNVLTNAALGAALPVGGAAARKGAKVAEEVGLTSALRLGTQAVGALPVVGAPARGLLNVAEHRASNKAMRHANALREYALETGPMKTAHTAAVREAKEVAKEQTKQVNKAAGEAWRSQTAAINAEAKERAAAALEGITSNFKVTATPSTVKGVRNLKSSYQGVLKGYPDLARALDQLTIPGAKMSGKTAAALKSKVGAAARDAKGGDRLALHEIERFITNTMYDNMPTARANALRDAFETYGKGARSELLPPKPTNVVIKPNTPTLNLPPKPMLPGTEPYSRTAAQAARTAALRAAAMREDRKEK